MYQRFEVIPPNHYGYVHFPAALLIIFGLMFTGLLGYLLLPAIYVTNALVRLVV